MSLFTFHPFHHHHHLFRLPEMAKLHLSHTLTTLGGSVIGIFIPVYLLSLDYSVLQIAYFYLLGQGLAPLTDYLSGYFTAKVGPKHVMRFGHLMKIALLVSLYYLPEYRALFYPTAVILQLQYMYSLAYFVEFSKLIETKQKTQKNRAVGGKQLGMAFTLSRFSAALGPIIGGYIIANYSFKVNLIIGIAFIVLAIYAINGHEPTRVHQKTKLRSLKLKTMSKDFFGFVGISYEFIIRNQVYGLFLALFVLSESSRFTGVGTIATISMFISVAASLWVGKLSDDGKGWHALKISSIKTSLINILRGFFFTPLSAGVVNAFNDSASVGVRIPLFSGFYRSVNDLEGYRISYWIKGFWIIDICRASFWIIFIVLLHNLDTKLAMQIMFIISGLVSLLLLKTKKLHEE